MADTRSVKGLAELDKFLAEFPVKFQRNVMRGAMRAGAKPMQVEIKATVPVKTGLYRDGIKISTSSKGGVVMAKIKATGKHAFLGPWFEYGAAAHKIVASKDKSLIFGGMFAKAVMHPGIAPKPAWRAALGTQATVSVLAVGEYMKKRLTKAGLESAADVEVEAE